MFGQGSARGGGGGREGGGGKKKLFFGGKENIWLMIGRSGSS